VNLEDPSSKSLLPKSSYTSTIDLENVDSPQAEGGRPRFRYGFKTNAKENIGQFWRRRPRLRERTTSTFEGHFAHGKPGWWHKQMLVDRSLRSMAGFTAVCAVAMLIIIFSYLSAFVKKTNLKSTSVGGRAGESCAVMEKQNVVRVIQPGMFVGTEELIVYVKAIHLFINIAATMVLGCSNTYQ
jgi:hypothetical protein